MLHDYPCFTPTCQYIHQYLGVFGGTSQAQIVAKDTLQLKLDTTSTERDALQADSESLRGRLAELVGVQQELAGLQVQHEAATARLVELEEQHQVGGSTSSVTAAWLTVRASLAAHIVR